MFNIGFGRRNREGYPQSRGLGTASVALQNRYLTGANGGTIPSPFTEATSANFAVGYTNVKRTASGLFVVGVQMPSALAGADVLVMAAILYSAPASGGVASGDWFVEQTGHLITAPSSGDALGPASSFEESSSAGNLTQTATVVGICPTPLPMGDEGSIVVFAGTTSGDELVTPAAFFAYAFELP